MRGETGLPAFWPGRRGRDAALLAGLVAAASGCGVIVTRGEFDKSNEQTQAQIQVVRKQLLAHTQILANHGKSINEVRLQLRDALASVRKAAKEKEAKAVSPPGKKKKVSSRPARRTAKGPPAGKRMYIRASYRGLPLNYAGGYRAPRGRRLPYRLPPGTAVEVLSGDQRGFTRIQVTSGRWKGKKMWVRTRWLVEKTPGRARSKKRG